MAPPAPAQAPVAAAPAPAPVPAVQPAAPTPAAPVAAAAPRGGGFVEVPEDELNRRIAESDRVAVEGELGARKASQREADIATLQDEELGLSAWLPWGQKNRATARLLGVGGVREALRPAEFEVAGAIQGLAKPFLEGRAEVRNPRQRGEQRNYADAVLDWMDKPEASIPFVGGALDAIEAGQLLYSAKRIADDEGDNNDWIRMLEFMKAQQQSGQKAQTFGATFIDASSQLPAFALEMYGTGGVFAAGKKGAIKALTKATQKVAERRIERGLAKKGLKGVQKEVVSRMATRAIPKHLGVKAAAVSAGAVVQSFAMPHRTAGALFDNMLQSSEFVEFDPEQQQFLQRYVTRTNDGFKTALYKAGADTAIETWSEHVGGALKYIPFRGKLQAMKMHILGAWMKRKGLGANEAVKAMQKKFFWNGVVGEYFEERVGEVARALPVVGTGEEFEPGQQAAAALEKGDIRELAPFINQSIGELMAFGLVPGGISIANRYSKMRRKFQKSIETQREQIQGPEAPADLTGEAQPAEPPPVPEIGIPQEAYDDPVIGPILEENEGDEAAAFADMQQRDRQEREVTAGRNARRVRGREARLSAMRDDPATTPAIWQAYVNDADGNVDDALDAYDSDVESSEEYEAENLIDVAATEAEETEADRVETELREADEAGRAEAVPVAEAAAANPYMAMPIARVQEDADQGVALAQQALEARQAEAAREEAEIPPAEPPVAAQEPITPVEATIVPETPTEAATAAQKEQEDAERDRLRTEEGRRAAEAAQAPGEEARIAEEGAGQATVEIEPGNIQSLARRLRQIDDESGAQRFKTQISVDAAYNFFDIKLGSIDKLKAKLTGLGFTGAGQLKQLMDAHAPRAAKPKPKRKPRVARKPRGEVNQALRDWRALVKRGGVRIPTTLKAFGEANDFGGQLPPGVFKKAGTWDWDTALDQAREMGLPVPENPDPTEFRKLFLGPTVSQVAEEEAPPTGEELIDRVPRQSKREVNESDLNVGDLVYTAGEWHRVAEDAESATGDKKLVDGDEITLDNFDNVNVREVVKEGEDLYSYALEEFQAQEGRRETEPKPEEVSAQKARDRGELFDTGKEDADLFDARDFVGEAATVEPALKAPTGETFWKGNRAEYTGEVVHQHGADWFEIRVLEGPSIGQTKLKPAKPQAIERPSGIRTPQVPTRAKAEPPPIPADQGELFRLDISLDEAAQQAIDLYGDKTSAVEALTRQREVLKRSLQSTKRADDIIGQLQAKPKESLEERLEEPPQSFAVTQERAGAFGTPSERATRAREVAEAIPGATVEQEGADLRITLPNGRKGIVRSVEKLPVSDAVHVQIDNTYPAEQRKELHALVDKQGVAGAFQGLSRLEVQDDAGNTISGADLVLLSDSVANGGTLRHELFHWADFMGLFTDKERAALVKRYGKGVPAASAEDIAQAFQTEQSIWQRVRDAILRMFGDAGATIEAEFRSGRVFERPAAAPTEPGEEPAFSIMPSRRKLDGDRVYTTIGRDAKERVAMDDTLKAHFGVTDEPAKAGYVLSDGTMLDLSGRKTDPLLGGVRLMDHNDLPMSVIEEADEMEPTNYVGAHGVMRTDLRSGFAEFGEEPSLAQTQWLIRNFEGRDLRLELRSPVNGNHMYGADFDTASAPGIRRATNEMREVVQGRRPPEDVRFIGTNYSIAPTSPNNEPEPKSFGLAFRRIGYRKTNNEFEPHLVVEVVKGSANNYANVFKKLGYRRYAEQRDSDVKVWHLSRPHAAAEKQLLMALYRRERGRAPAVQPEVPPVQQPVDELLDDWFANKDEMFVDAEVDARNLQLRLSDFTGSRTMIGKVMKNSIDFRAFGPKERELDMAMHLYVDLLDAPGGAAGQLAKYGAELTSEQRKLFELSQNLPEAVKKIADDIIVMNRRTGEFGVEGGVLHALKSNYAMRLWETSEQEEKRQIRQKKFSGTTRRALPQTLESIAHGWSLGKQLRVKGATNAMLISRREVAQAVEDRRLMELAAVQGLVASERKAEDWVEIEHPNFARWEWVGQGEDVDIFTPDVFVDESGNVFKRRKQYAEPVLGKKLNRVLGTSKLMGVPGFQTITKVNAVMKATILFTSLFHHQAFLRSYMLGSKGFRPGKAWQEGREAVLNFTPEARDLVRGGLTIGLIQDWDESIQAERGRLGARIEAAGGGKVKRKILDLWDAQTNFLFGKMGPYLKMQAGILEYRDLLRKNRAQLEAGTRTRHEYAKMAANLANDDFGGLHLGRLGRDPTLQHLFRLVALAPDWTESNIRSMVKTLKAGEEGQMYRQFWGRIAIKGMGLTVLANLLLSMGDDDEEEEFLARYKRAWDEGHLRWLDVDVTPAYKLFGGKSERRKYFSLIGHFRDPVKFIAHPTRSAKHKSSAITRVVMDGIQGEDWAGRPFTTWDELLGVDDKGVYKTSRKGKFKEGDPKGGKLAGELVQTRRGAAGPVGISQLPSYVLYETRSTTPIQVQNAIAWMSGEMEGWDALSKSLGLMTSTTYEPLEGEEPANISTGRTISRTVETSIGRSVGRSL